MAPDPKSQPPADRQEPICWEELPIVFDEETVRQILVALTAPGPQPAASRQSRLRSVSTVSVTKARLSHR